MKVISQSDAFQVLLLQAADDGRGPVLFGESMQRARECALPFIVGKSFPSVYLEHPLIGDPFLDVTVLLGELNKGTRIDSPAAGNHAAMLDWFANVKDEQEDICCGFELDTKEETLPVAAIHFQPRGNTELVRPFCEAAGEPERAELYLDLASRMPDGWPLSFFGMFRGRAAFPLRVCGYLNNANKETYAHDAGQLAQAFNEVGFSAYDDSMLSQISSLMAAAPGSVDFQFDVYPDGRIGDIFAIDLQFGIEQPEKVIEKFETGEGARVMGLLENWGVADDRWKLAIQSAFARAIPVQQESGETAKFAFTLMPQWVKARWSRCELQPAKLYHLAQAGLVDEERPS